MRSDTTHALRFPELTCIERLLATPDLEMWYGRCARDEIDILVHIQARTGHDPRSDGAEQPLRHRSAAPRKSCPPANQDRPFRQSVRLGKSPFRGFAGHARDRIRARDC